MIIEDNGMATLCKFRNVPYLHLDVSLKTRVIVEKLKKLQKDLSDFFAS